MERNTTKLRTLLAKGELIVAPGGYDALTGRIIESLGFPAVYMGGNATGAHLCTSEPLTTMTETVDNAQRVMRGIEVPLIVDADAGFGDAVHTYRSVREFERAGVAAIHIEDQPFPKRAHYHKRQGRIVELTEVLDKLKAALDARRDPDFVIIARTDAHRVVSREAGIERCQAYVELGVDMLMVTGMSPEDGVAIRKAVPKVPMVWLSGSGGPELSTKEVAEMGYQLMIYPSSTVVAMVDAVSRIWTNVREKGTTGLSDDIVTPTRQKVMELIGLPKYWDIEAKTTEKR